MANEVFISYRRSDDPYLAHLLYEKLQATLPAGSVFLDVRSIEFGADFRTQINRAIEHAKTLLAVIGRHWLTVTDDNGNRRIFKDDDIVRHEIATALERRILVLPIVASEARIPQTLDLPSDIQGLADLNMFPIRADHGLDANIRLLLEIVQKRLGATLSTPNFHSSTSVAAPTGARGLIAVVICPPDGRKKHWMRAGENVRDIAEAPELLVIPPGRFRMGAPDYEAGSQASERPQRNVTIGVPFLIGRYPVTIGEWRQFIKDKPLLASNVADVGADDNCDLPAVNVSWLDAQAYTRWLVDRTQLPYRLPTEAEWEYVARAGSMTPYWWGQECNPKLASYEVSDEANVNDARGALRVVNKHHSNAWGISDILGNVAEWVEDDWHDTYDSAPTNGGAWLTPGKETKVVRGGSWRSTADALRCAARTPLPSGARLDHVGFRVARSLLLDD